MELKTNSEIYQIRCGPYVMMMEANMAGPGWAQVAENNELFTRYNKFIGDDIWRIIINSIRVNHIKDEVSQEWS